LTRDERPEDRDALVMWRLAIWRLELRLID
jgi:hypothetical protein